MHDRGHVILRRRGKDHSTRARIKMLFNILSCAKHTGRFKYQFHPVFRPWNLGRVSLAVYRDFRAMDILLAIAGLSGAGKTAVDRIVLQEIS